MIITSRKEYTFNPEDKDLYKINIFVLKENNL